VLGKLLVRLTESSLTTILFQDRASNLRQSHKRPPPQSDEWRASRSRLAIAPDFTLAEEGLDIPANCDCYLGHELRGGVVVYLIILSLMVCHF
jgi:hypothetical protein